MSVNKLERLLNLTAVLLETRRPLSAEEICRRVDGYPPAGTAFRRTFERDKDDLRVLGVPLQVKRIENSDPPIDGYLIDPDDYYLPDPGLSGEELAALRLALMVVKIEGSGDDEALWKLGGGGEGQLESTPAEIANLPTDPALVPLFDAVTSAKQCTFAYRSEARLVDPWRLDFQRGRWYLTGFDHTRNGKRSFRLDRIEGEVTVSDQAVTVQHSDELTGVSAKPWELGDTPVVMAKLKVDRGRAESAARQLGIDPDENEDQGSDSADHSISDGVIFSVPVANFDGFRSFALGLLDHAEILEPLEWRNETTAWLADIAGNEVASDA